MGAVSISLIGVNEREHAAAANKFGLRRRWRPPKPSAGVSDDSEPDRVERGKSRVLLHGAGEMPPVFGSGRLPSGNDWPVTSAYIDYTGQGLPLWGTAIAVVGIGVRLYLWRRRPQRRREHRA